MRRRASPSSSGREISSPVGVEDADVDEDAEESVAGAGGTIGAARASLKTAEAMDKADDEQRRPVLSHGLVTIEGGRFEDHHSRFVFALQAAHDQQNIAVVNHVDIPLGLHGQGDIQI